jgi:hypothetical protein
MEKISSPQQPHEYPDRALDCEEAMRRAFRELLQDAIAVGWEEAEVALIVADVAEDYVMELAQKRSVRKIN